MPTKVADMTIEVSADVIREELESADNPDIAEWSKRLSSVSDEDLRCELSKLQIDINDDKFTQAISAYVLTDVLCNLDNKILRSFIKEGSLKQIIPDEELNSIRFRGAMVIRAYIAFVYMRSKQLERCLDSIKENSPIRPFRDFFRQGSKKNSSDTIGQHIRNSLSHGDFKLSDDLKSVQFNDRTRQYKIDSKLFYEGLCHQLERFYFRFYEVRNKRIL